MQAVASSPAEERAPGPVPLSGSPRSAARGSSVAPFARRSRGSDRPAPPIATCRAAALRRARAAPATARRTQEAGGRRRDRWSRGGARIGRRAGRSARAARRGRASDPLPVSISATPAVACGTKTCSRPSPPTCRPRSERPDRSGRAPSSCGLDAERLGMHSVSPRTRRERDRGTPLRGGRSAAVRSLRSGRELDPWGPKRSNVRLAALTYACNDVIFDNVEDTSTARHTHPTTRSAAGSRADFPTTGSAAVGGHDRSRRDPRHGNDRATGSRRRRERRGASCGASPPASDGFREDTRARRMKIADEAQHRFGRTVSWGATCADHRVPFTTLSVPAMTRLRQPERRVLDTWWTRASPAAGATRSRGASASWRSVRTTGSATCGKR